MFIDKGKFSMILPGCCEKNIKTGMPFLELPNNKPEWRCPNQQYEVIMSLNNDNILNYYNSDLSVKFCPFCGSELPDVIKVDRGNLKTHRDKDGGYYCDSCNKRNSQCECYPEVILYEVNKSY